MPQHDQLIKEAEKRRAAYENGKCDYPTVKETNRWNQLLKGISSGRSEASRSILRRAQNLAVTVLTRLGPDVLLLIVSSLNRRQMSQLNTWKVIQDLEEWWPTVSHPSALHEVAMKCFATDTTNVASLPAQQSPKDVVYNGQHAIPELRSATMRAALEIPRLEDRNAWLTIALANIHLLKRMSCTNNEDGLSAKYAIMPKLDKMESYLGEFLYKGVQASHMRSNEQLLLTRALRLCLPSDLGEDFILEIWLCSSFGITIQEATRTMTFADEWKKILGDYLYAAMMNSKSRKIEEDTGVSPTGAARISPPNSSNYDYKLEVMMSFETGQEVWSAGFP